MSPRRRLPYYALLDAKKYTLYTQRTYGRRMGGNHVCLILSQGVGFLVKRPLLVQLNNDIVVHVNRHRAERKINNNGSNERPRRSILLGLAPDSLCQNQTKSQLKCFPIPGTCCLTIYFGCKKRR